MFLSQRLQNHPWLVAYAIAFIALMVTQRPYLWAPAYHDFLAHWRVANTIHENRMFPWIQTGDTGHPTLVAWGLALFWFLPFDRIALMHIYMWFAGALMHSSLFEITRIHFGIRAAIGSTLIMFVHPLVFAQTTNLSTDLMMASFIIFSIYGMVSGKPVIISVGLTLAALTKLNGILAAGPFLTLWFFHCIISGRWKDWRYSMRFFAPLSAPFIALILFSVGKFFFFQRFFDSGEYEGGEQMRLVSSFERFGELVFHSFSKAALRTNVYLTIAALTFGLCTLIVIMLNQKFERNLFIKNAFMANDRIPWSPCSRESLLLILWLTLITQIFFQSIRDFRTLNRYFIVLYPTLIITLYGAIALWPIILSWISWIIITFALSIFFWGKHHPENAGRLPGALEEFVYPPARYVSNGEGNLMYLERLKMIRKSQELVATHFSPSAKGKIRWPVSSYYSNPIYNYYVTLHQIDHLKGDFAIQWSSEVVYPEQIIPDGYQILNTWNRYEQWVAAYQKSPPEPGAMFRLLPTNITTDKDMMGSYISGCDNIVPVNPQIVGEETESYISIPDGNHLLAKFDEDVIIGPGTVIGIGSANGANETASLVAVLKDQSKVFISQVRQSQSSDVETVWYAMPYSIRGKELAALELESRSNAGCSPGFDLNWIILTHPQSVKQYPGSIYSEYFDSQLHSWETGYNVNQAWGKPEFILDENGLGVTGNGITPCMGYLISPTLNLTTNQKLKVIFRVVSTAEPKKCPSFRIRVNDFPAGMTQTLEITSNESQLAPGPNGRYYSFIYTPTTDQSEIQINFDYMAFLEDDDSTATIYLSEIHLVPVK